MFDFTALSAPSPWQPTALSLPWACGGLLEANLGAQYGTRSRDVVLLSAVARSF